MGRPGALCGLCPDSRHNQRPTVGECATCVGVRYCRKHLEWYEDAWRCTRCIRYMKAREARK